MSSYALIIPAAGSGTRMGSDVPKQFVDINAVPTLTHVLRAFADDPNCIEIVIAASPEFRVKAESCVPSGMNVTFVDGGESRQRSVGRAVMSIASDANYVLIHDAARPCVRQQLIDRVFAATIEFGAAIPVLAVTDTIKRVDDNGVVIETLRRDTLRSVQTPQGFVREHLVEAHRRAAGAKQHGTDDAMLIEALGYQVHTVDGDPTNIKITVAADVSAAEQIFNAR